MDEYRQTADDNASLPAQARLSINHCNLPPVILGSLTFQQHPAPLHLDGVSELHSALFSNLAQIDDAAERAENFQDYMRSGFLLDHLEEAGLPDRPGKKNRHRADYLRILRGWLFDPDGKEAAVLKGWVESRFGLLPRNHQGPLGDINSLPYQHYLAARTQGLYNTNALESQLDLLYTYCQYEVQRRYPAQTHLTLYRGINRIDEHEVLHQPARHVYILVLNNINSFTGERERADEFGDYILEAKVPLSKLVYLPGLLPGRLSGEDEYLVIGGVYEVALRPF
ncbi:NAD(+)--dinitrogen-reductase ADP-D-ribosyltransferase [Sedimenticola sp.]|uniref:NAD(+)--dinitrogen-reductase ADP-D-ribosyltransferase n=1 Tax=Sedimenticola sp. TaxID=1940285 RepID=UPI003D11AF9A